jgi:hypothetical protein
MNYNEQSLLTGAIIMLRGAISDMEDARPDMAVARLRRALDALDTLKEDAQ